MPRTRSPDPAPEEPTGRRRALSAAALEGLGAPRLAELLMAAAGRDPVLARGLRLALAGAGGAGGLALAVEKRMAVLARSRGRVAWAKVRPLARELDDLRGTIAGLAGADPGRAAALMRRLLELSDGVMRRCEDGGAVGEVFGLVAAELGRLWTLLPRRDPVGLAGEVLALLDADRQGVAEGLLEAATPALGPEGRAELRRLLLGRLAASQDGDAGSDAATEEGWDADWGAGPDPDPHAAWGPDAPGDGAWDVAEDAAGRARPGGHGLAAWRLRRLADLEDDVDAFLAAVEAEGRPGRHALDAAGRLLEHGRAAEALAWLDRAPAPDAAPYGAEWAMREEPDGAGDLRREDEAVAQAGLRARALEALGGAEEARALRWELFARWLRPEPLRDALRGLPGFEDVAAEERAVALALAHPDRARALAFLSAWPDLPAAARLAREHHAALDGGDYRRLRPAAEALSERHPQAATLLYRRLVEDVLARGSSRQHAFAVRDLRACADLAPFLPEDPEVEGHDAFLLRLRREFGHRAGFRGMLEGRR